MSLAVHYYDQFCHRRLCRQDRKDTSAVTNPSKVTCGRCLRSMKKRGVITQAQEILRRNKRYLEQLRK